jgi:UDP:flavonoid glycosyltransferase YjiC (YdhE family)
MIILVPFRQDQFKVARRVEVADAGTRLPAGRLRPDRLRAAVREAMTKRARAERIASVFAAAGGPKAAVEALEELPGGTDIRSHRASQTHCRIGAAGKWRCG